MLVFLILLCCIAVFLGIYYVISFIFKKIDEKYYKFLINNSISIKNLEEINSRYIFYNVDNFYDGFTYDNPIYYDSVSCEDFLIYQLQYEKYKIEKEIKIAEQNGKLYEKYKEEIKNIRNFGNYKNSTVRLDESSLIRKEKEMFYKMTIKPKTNCSIFIKLKLSNLNGRVYDWKEKSFNSNAILDYIKRLNNKTGNFYNDIGIWNALCRVERAKVSNKMRFAIYSRDGYRCKNCGASGDDVDLEIDHIKPIAKGGKSIYSNLQTLCKKCNDEKSDKY